MESKHKIEKLLPFMEFIVFQLVIEFYFTEMDVKSSSTV